MSRFPFSGLPHPSGFEGGQAPLAAALQQQAGKSLGHGEPPLVPAGRRGNDPAGGVRGAQPVRARWCVHTPGAAAAVLRFPAQRNAAAHLQLFLADHRNHPRARARPGAGFRASQHRVDGLCVHRSAGRRRAWLGHARGRCAARAQLAAIPARCAAGTGRQRHDRPSGVFLSFPRRCQWHALPELRALYSRQRAAVHGRAFLRPVFQRRGSG